MQRPVQLTWRHVEPSEAVASLVRKKAERLERYFDRITGCTVALEQPQQHHRQGDHYRVRVEVTVPGEKLVVGRSPLRSRVHEDLYSAVSAAFREVRRKLVDRVGRLGRRTQEHQEPARGVVVRVFPEDGYGFLQTQDGREVYFHERSVLRGGFGRLRVGSRVRFAEEPGRDGPQASSVVPTGARARAAP